MNEELKMKYKWASAIPIICTIVYFTLAYILDAMGIERAYLYSLVVFIFVPFNYIIVGLKKFTIGYPALITILYFVLVFILRIATGKGYWHPLWIIFLTIPLYYIFYGNKKIGEKKENKPKDYVDFDADK